ncbi:hypothetical protein AB1Y20_003572 [Prymnesium parvum]|uniref:PCIF1 WW domain-containing protein n=1 Tax=Prymnesium parvum TaxID=97485 RepID=A0AB34J761_PRYPA
MVRLALAQRAAWLRARHVVKTFLSGSNVGVLQVGRVLKAFDGLPFHSDAAEAHEAWLPSAAELEAEGCGLRARLREVPGGESLISQLTDVLSEEMAALSSLEEEDAPSEVRLVEGTDGLQSLVWRGGGEQAREAGGDSFEVSGRRLAWLRRQHAQVVGGRSAEACADEAALIADEPLESLFRKRTFQMLARYDGMGGGSAGSGNHAAVPPEVFEVFEDWAQVPRGACIECFASPLNHRVADDTEAAVKRNPGGKKGSKKQQQLRAQSQPPSPPPASPPPAGPARFFSAFPVTDAPFGSRGSFLAEDSLSSSLLSEGGHTLLLFNPPFFARHMDQIAPRLDRFLETLTEQEDIADQSAAPPPRVTALVVVPAMGERRSYEVPHLVELMTSPFFRAQLTVRAGEHAYCHGLAHKRTHSPSTRHISGFDTSIFLFSNLSDPPARKRNFETLLKKVSAAFRSTSSAARIRISNHMF